MTHDPDTALADAWWQAQSARDRNRWYRWLGRGEHVEIPQIEGQLEIPVPDVTP